MLARLRDQLGDIAAMQKKQAALKLSAQAADGTVEVTVNARGQLVKTVIDKSYLDDHDFDELGDYITEAAQTAARDVGGRVAELLAPINERHKTFPTFSDIVEGLPDPSDLMLPGVDAFPLDRQRQAGPAVSSAGGPYDDGDGEAEFPTVRR
jgi:DNA-binding protein YbaB